MTLPYEIRMIVLIALGTLVFVGSLASLKSMPLFQPGSRVLVAICVSILSVIGLLGIPYSNVPDAPVAVNEKNGILAGILCLYAALAMAMLIVLLLRCWFPRAAKRNERYRRFDPRSTVGNRKMKRKSYESELSERWENPIAERDKTDPPNW